MLTKIKKHVYKRIVKGHLSLLLCYYLAFDSEDRLMQNKIVMKSIERELKWLSKHADLVKTVIEEDSEIEYVDVEEIIDSLIEEINEYKMQRTES